MKGLVFRGKHSDQFNLIVNEVQRSLLPPLSSKTVSIPNRDGGYFFGNDKGMRQFKVTMTLNTKNSSDLWRQLHEINSWLFSDEEEELVFDQEPELSYFAFVSGDTDLSRFATHGGTFTIIFICPDPYGYLPNLQSEIYTTSPIVQPITGNEPTFPIYLARFSQPSSFFSLATKNNHVFVGSSAAAEEEVEVPGEVLVINDGMSSTASWQPNPTVEGGEVTGSFESTGKLFKPFTYGSGAGWHGPSLRRVIDTPVQDFKMETIVGFISELQNEVGRIVIDLQDANGVVIGKIGLRDAWDYEQTIVDARAGNETNGHALMAYIGDIEKKTRKVTTQKKVQGKTVTDTDIITEGFSTYANFYGMLRLQRVGNLWTARVGKIDAATGRHHTRLEVNWRDTNNQFMSKVAAVAVTIQQHGSKPFVRTTYVSQVQLFQINTPNEEAGEVPQIILAGDEIEVDMETGAVYKNGEPFLDEVNISSEFFSLPAGNNQIAFAPADKCTLQVFHRGRYL